MESEPQRYRGSCHCGAVQFELATGLPPEAWALRSCGCSFCRRHQPRYFSDPKGLVQFRGPNRGGNDYYRFGTESADFLTCRDCGTFVAAIQRGKPHDVCVVNVNTLDPEPPGLPSATPVWLGGETAETRRQRRREKWTPVDA